MSVQPELVDPRDAFLANGPTPLVAAATPVASASAVLIGAAVVTGILLVRRELRREHPATAKEVKAVARNAWKKILPNWMKVALPAVTQAYSIGSTGRLTYDELTLLATDYATELGEYVNETSASALMEGFAAQVNSGWSGTLAWERAKEAYGLDARQMRSYISGLMAQDPKSYITDPVSATSRALINQAVSVRAERIGSNEAHKATQVGKNMVWMTMAAHGDIPEDTKKMWRTAEDEFVCEVCGPLDGVIIPLHWKFKASTGERFYAPGVHPNCFPAGTVVSGPKALASMSRWYEGEMIRVVTADGGVLTVTPNHPLLTSEGWIAAGLVNDQTYLVRESDLERMSAGDPDDYQPPAFIEEVLPSGAETLASASSRVPVTTEDFHGDGFDGYVDVVRADSLLLDGAEIAQPSSHQSLSNRSADTLTLSRSSNFGAMLRALAFTPDGIVSRYGQRAALLRAGTGHTLEHGLGPITLSDADVVEGADDSAATDAFLFGEALNALTGVVTLDKVIDVVRYPFAGHVYNLETVDSWYTANGFIVHNCRCTLEIVYPEPEWNDIVKMMPGDPFDRDSRGRFATSEQRSATDILHERKPKEKVDPSNPLSILREPKSDALRYVGSNPAAREGALDVLRSGRVQVSPMAVLAEAKQAEEAKEKTSEKKPKTKTEAKPATEQQRLPEGRNAVVAFAYGNRVLERLGVEDTDRIRVGTLIRIPKANGYTGEESLDKVLDEAIAVHSIEQRNEERWEQNRPYDRTTSSISTTPVIMRFDTWDGDDNAGHQNPPWLGKSDAGITGDYVVTSRGLFTIPKDMLSSDGKDPFTTVFLINLKPAH